MILTTFLATETEPADWFLVAVRMSFHPVIAAQAISGFGVHGDPRHVTERDLAAGGGIRGTRADPQGVISEEATRRRRRYLRAGRSAADVISAAVIKPATELIERPYWLISSSLSITRT